MEKRLKILVITYLFPNRNKLNHGIFVLNRIKALSQHVDIKVINPIPWFPAQGIFNRYKFRATVPLEDSINGIEVYHPRFLSFPRVLKNRESARYLMAIRDVMHGITNGFDFDIVDMHWTFPDLPAGLAIGKEYNKQTIVTLRGMEALHEQDDDQRHQIVAAGLREVDIIIALSQELKRRGDELSGNTIKSVVVRNGVDTKLFHYLPMDECRQHTGIHEDEVVILSVGSLIYRKGFDLIIRSIAKLKKANAHKSLKLYIVGSEGAEGDYRRELRQLIDRLGVGSEIIFVGQIANSELKYWYGSANIFCLASRGEGSPNVLSEALACGCPSITTDVGSAREIVNTGPNLGLCIKSGSETELLSAIEELLARNPDRIGNSDFYSQFSWDWCAEQVLLEYRKCVQSR